jgi:hypothetical protein
MKIKIALNNKPNKDFLLNTEESDTDVGLFYSNVGLSYAESGRIIATYIYEVINKQLFMLAVLKYGIVFEEVLS